MEPEDEPKPFKVHVFGTLYTAKDGVVKIPYDPTSSECRKSYRRHTRKGQPPESAIDMQKRIEGDLVDVLHERVRRTRLLSTPSDAC